MLRCTSCRRSSRPDPTIDAGPGPLLQAPTDQLGLRLVVQKLGVVLLDASDDVPERAVSLTYAPLFFLLGSARLLTPSTERDERAVCAAHEDRHDVLNCDADAVLAAFVTGQGTERADVPVRLPHIIGRGSARWTTQLPGLGTVLTQPLHTGERGLAPAMRTDWTDSAVVGVAIEVQADCPTGLAGEGAALSFELRQIHPSRPFGSALLFSAERAGVPFFGATDEASIATSERRRKGFVG